MTLLGKFFPELKPALQKVTIRQLANHTNGIHDFYSLTTRHDPVNKQEALTMLSNLDTTLFTPGSKWGYSNSGYLLLSEIIERAIEMIFQDYSLKNVLSTLGMKSACYLPFSNEVLYGYTEELKPITFNAFSSGEAGMYASGMVISYLPDQVQVIIHDTKCVEVYSSILHQEFKIAVLFLYIR